MNSQLQPVGAFEDGRLAGGLRNDPVPHDNVFQIRISF